MIFWVISVDKFGQNLTQMKLELSYEHRIQNKPDSQLNWMYIARFRECIIALNETFRKAETLPQQAIREKYKSEK